MSIKNIPPYIRVFNEKGKTIDVIYSIIIYLFMHYIYFLPNWDLLRGLIFLAKLGGRKTTEKESESEIKAVSHHSFISHKGLHIFIISMYITTLTRLG